MGRVRLDNRGPVIARSLAPLRPNREEIAATIDRLRADRVKIGRALRAEDIADAIGFAVP